MRTTVLWVVVRRHQTFILVIYAGTPMRDGCRCQSCCECLTSVSKYVLLKHKSTGVVSRRKYWGSAEVTVWRGMVCFKESEMLAPSQGRRLMEMLFYLRDLGLNKWNAPVLTWVLTTCNFNSYQSLHYPQGRSFPQLRDTFFVQWGFSRWVCPQAYWWSFQPLHSPELLTQE